MVKSGGVAAVFGVDGSVGFPQKQYLAMKVMIVTLITGSSEYDLVRPCA